MIRQATVARLAAVALLALALLAGCGEKAEPATTGPVVTQTTAPTTSGSTVTSTDGTTTGKEPGPTDQRLAVGAAMRFLSSPDPAVCESGVTPGLLGRAYGDRAGCVAARKRQGLAKAARFSQVRIGQGTATLTANARGGVYGGGEKLMMSVVRDGAGIWRVDKVHSNVPVGP